MGTEKTSGVAEHILENNHSVDDRSPKLVKTEKIPLFIVFSQYVFFSIYMTNRVNRNKISFCNISKIFIRKT